MTAAEVIYDSGTAHLRFQSPSLTGVAKATLIGRGTLSVDPTDPAQLIAVDLDSDDLDDLAGIMTVHTRIATEDRDRQLVESVDAGPRLQGLQRLAFANWYSIWTPLPIERSLVRLDVAAAAWEAGQRVRAYDIFDEQFKAILNLARGEEAFVHEAVTNAVRDTAAQAVVALGDDDPRAVELTEALAPPARAVAPVRELVLAGVRARQQSTAPPLPPCDVDWTRVPPRTLDTDDGTILWERDGNTVLVTVTAHECIAADSPGKDRLIVRLLQESTGDPIIAAPLEFHPGEGSTAATFRARLPIEEDLDQYGVVVDVVDARLLKPSRTGDDVRWARLERAATRALAWTRLAGVAATLDPAWQKFIPYEDYLRPLEIGLHRLTADQTTPLSAARAREWLDTVAKDPAAALKSPPLLSELVTASRMVQR